MIIETRAYARAGLLGNPSDGYFGKTISIIIRNFGAHVSLYESPELHIEPQETDINVFRNIHHLLETVQMSGYYGGSRLIKATIKKFIEYCEWHGIRLPIKNFTIRYNSSIPRQVGLAGSSAIVTATMRALMQFYDVKIPLEILPTLVLSTEVDELGIQAGLQDRVIQTYEGCVYMDFEKDYLESHNHGKYEKLDPSHLPNLYIAYKIDLSKVSGKVLSPLRARYDQGDSKVIKTLNRIAAIAEEGREAILAKNADRLFELMNENFDCRSKIIAISESNKELVHTARGCGASAKFTGSGGSIIGIYQDDTMLRKLVIQLNKINARVIRPFIV
jgi:glucuronokinase